MSKVMVRVPTYDAHERGLSRWFNWAGKAHPEWDVDYYYQTAGVCETRNEIVLHFLQSDAEVLWMIDSDVTPPMSDAILQVDAPVVSGLYAHYHPQAGAHFQVYRRVDPEEPVPATGRGHMRFYLPQDWPQDGETFHADAAGTGCMVIQRAVLEKMQQDKTIWFAFEYKEGRRIGEDFTFCEKVGGVEVLPSYVCEHVRKVNLTDLVALTQYASVGFDAMKEKQAGAPQVVAGVGGSTEGEEESEVGAREHAPEEEDGEIPPAPPPLESLFAEDGSTVSDWESKREHGSEREHAPVVRPNRRQRRRRKKR